MINPTPPPTATDVIAQVTRQITDRLEIVRTEIEVATTEAARLEAILAAVRNGTAPAITRKAAPAPTDKTARYLTPPDAKKTTPAAKPAPAKNARKLRDVLFDLLAASPTPLDANSLTEPALAGGYQTASKDFRAVIFSTLSSYPDVFKKNADGTWKVKAAAAAKKGATA